MITLGDSLFHYQLLLPIYNPKDLVFLMIRELYCTVASVSKYSNLYASCNITLFGDKYTDAFKAIKVK